MPFQQTLSSHLVFLIPWGTSANNLSKAKVFHIMKVESKSISYHAFSLSFSLSLFWDKEKKSNQPALGINLLIWNRLPGTLPDCLPSLALEYSSSSFYATSSSTTFAWGTDKGSENDTSKHVEIRY
ncbi:hypothetical protein ACFX10_003208 [Malus domestica]